MAVLLVKILIKLDGTDDFKEYILESIIAIGILCVRDRLYHGGFCKVISKKIGRKYQENRLLRRLQPLVDKLKRPLGSLQLSKFVRFYYRRKRKNDKLSK